MPLKPDRCHRLKCLQRVVCSRLFGAEWPKERLAKSVDQSRFVIFGHVAFRYTFARVMVARNELILCISAFDFLFHASMTLAVWRLRRRNTPTHMTCSCAVKRFCRARSGSTTLTSCPREPLIMASVCSRFGSCCLLAGKGGSGNYRRLHWSASS